MHEIDRTAMGQRIKAIRNESRLRQWELARMLGTTQSAVHKYEHGVVPEPRRLLEIARIGGTTIEWILTGRHGEGGTAECRRVPPEILQTATALVRLDDYERRLLDEALAILDEAVSALGDGTSDPVRDVLAAARILRERVIGKVLADARSRLSASD